jgi:hypothetical protein
MPINSKYRSANKKYGLTPDEIVFVETKIKDMA